MPIGQNDAITWPDLGGCYGRRDLASVERYLATLAGHGVTCLRLMLEYSQGQRHYFERPAGRFQPRMIQLWDDLFALCEQYGLRILLTPFDTFWMWNRWSRHPYNCANGGPCADRARFLLCPETRKYVKARLAFATERWGASGVVFAWDLFNEIHPAQAESRGEPLYEIIEDLSTFLRELEIRLHGRAHPQTVSMFGPHMVLDPCLPGCILRHPSLDFASTHFYEEGTIDYPQNTVDAAISTGRLMREALAEISDERPFLDSEHGPIHSFKDHHLTLPEPFDDEYFRHMQWAHFASGGAGGGMRWPNRDPHGLTMGMRAAQRGLAGFLPFIEWRRFHRRNLNEELGISLPGVKGFACGDDQQAVIWLLRADSIGPDGLLRRDAEPVAPVLAIPGLRAGRYRATAWDTLSGVAVAEFQYDHTRDGQLCLEAPPFVADLALAIRSQDI